MEKVKEAQGGLICVAVICISVPMIVYRNFERKASVVERIKGFE